MKTDMSGVARPRAHGQAMTRTDTEIQTVLESRLSTAGIDLTTAAITIGGAQGASGAPLSVQVVYPYQYLVLDRFASALGATFNLTAQTVMFME